jgi:predicted transposase YbfD/YdcC
VRSAETIDKGHARLEHRRIETLSRMPSLVNFPGAKQIGRIHRERTTKGVKTTEIVCFVTSLPRLKANAKALLELSRSHWSIENKLHRVRDVTFGEDACTVTSGNAPQAWAAIRNAVLTLLRQNKFRNIARALRNFAAYPAAALKLLGASLTDF